LVRGGGKESHYKGVLPTPPPPLPKGVGVGRRRGEATFPRQLGEEGEGRNYIWTY